MGLTLSADKIVKYALPLLKKTVLEVGPGPGSLTRSIINAGTEKVVVVEKDSRFIPALQTIQSSIQPNRMHIHRDDILKIDQKKILEDVGVVKVDWNQDAEVKVLGNLPFGVSTELLLRWIHQIPNREGPFYFGRAPMILMFQKEVAMVPTKPMPPSLTASYCSLAYLCTTRNKTVWSFVSYGSTFM